MNQDIRIEISFRGHRKRRKLQALLGAGATGHLIDLWVGSAISRPNGVLDGYDALDIAMEAGWSGDPREFVEALVEVGFLDVLESGTYALHDWGAHQPFVVQSKEREARASKAANARWSRRGSAMGTANDRDMRMKGATPRRAKAATEASREPTERRSDAAPMQGRSSRGGSERQAVEMLDSSKPKAPNLPDGPAPLAQKMPDVCSPHAQGMPDASAPDATGMPDACSPHAGSNAPYRTIPNIANTDSLPRIHSASAPDGAARSFPRVFSESATGRVTSALPDAGVGSEPAALPATAFADGSPPVPPPAIMCSHSDLPGSVRGDAAPDFLDAAGAGLPPVTPDAARGDSASVPPTATRSSSPADFPEPPLGAGSASGPPDSAIGGCGPRSPTASGSPSVYLSKRKRRLGGWKLETFEAFWEAFGLKKGKAEAADAWLDIPDFTPELAATVIEAAAKEARARPALIARGGTPKWAQGWLAGRRWEDWDGAEPDPTGTSPDRGTACSREMNHDPKVGSSDRDETARYQQAIREAVRKFM